MNVDRLLLFSFSCLCISTGSSYKILSVLPTAFKSHWIIGTSVLRQLSRAGHEVTLISPFPFDEENVTNILMELPTAFSNPFELYQLSAINYFSLLPKLMEEYQNLIFSSTSIQKLQKTQKFDVVIVEIFQCEALYAQINAFDIGEMSLYTNFLVLADISAKNTEFTLTHPNVQNILKTGIFDLVIVEIFDHEALFALGNFFDCPVIGVTTFGASEWTNIITNTPNPTSYNPNIFTPYTDHMTFFQRLHNLFVWWMEEILWHTVNYPVQEQIYEKYLKKYPYSLMDVIRNVSLILNNQHFSFTTIKPLMPNVIDIGGITVDPNVKPLPDDIKEFLDSATDGAIIFSMGSIIQSVQWPLEKRESFVGAFSKIKQKVLWKYENDTLPNKPENVMISKWIPQRDVLAHPNVRLFIGHGGLLGTTEAMYEGIPILAIPIFGDQKMNMKMAREKGFSFLLDFNNLNEKIVLEALKKAVNDEQIHIKAKEYSKIVKDRPMTPHDSAVYWVEYVIRNKGAPYLKSAARNLSYIQVHNVDIYLFVLMLLFLIIHVVYSLIKFIINISMTKYKKQKLQ